MPRLAAAEKDCIVFGQHLLAAAVGRDEFSGNADQQRNVGDVFFALPCLKAVVRSVAHGASNVKVRLRAQADSGAERLVGREPHILRVVVTRELEHTEIW